MLDDITKVMHIKLKPADLQMLQDDNPEALVMMQRMNQGADTPAWEVVAEDAELNDSMEARIAAKRRRVAAKKAAR